MPSRYESGLHNKRRVRVSPLPQHGEKEGAHIFEDFFAQANLNPNASLITGSICGVKVQNIEDPLMQKIPYLDKLVDELAKGRPMDKVLRS